MLSSVPGLSLQSLRAPQLSTNPSFKPTDTSSSAISPSSHQMPPEHKAQLQTSTTELGQPFFTPTSLDDEDSSYDPIEPLSSMSLAALRRLAGYKPPPDPCQ